MFSYGFQYSIIIYVNVKFNSVGKKGGGFRGVNWREREREKESLEK
jgi:hypothetical protein